jgi:hypothetical protein
MKRVNKCGLISRSWTQAEDFLKTPIADHLSEEYAMDAARWLIE